MQRMLSGSGKVKDFIECCNLKPMFAQKKNGLGKFIYKSDFETLR